MAFVSRRFRSIVLESYEHYSQVLPKGSRESTEHGGFGLLLTSTGEDVEYEELLNPSTPTGEDVEYEELLNPSTP